MTRRPQLLLCGLAILTLAGLPLVSDPRPEDAGAPLPGRPELARLELEITALAHDVEASRTGVKNHGLDQPGPTFPQLCDQFARELLGLDERAHSLRISRQMTGPSLERFEQLVQEPLALAGVELELLEAHGQQVMTLVQARQRMRTELSRGNRRAALAVFRARPRGEFDLDTPELVDHLLAQLDDLAFCARNQHGPGLRDQRTY